MAAETTWVRKGDEKRLINRSDLPAYVEQKFEEYRPPMPEMKPGVSRPPFKTPLNASWVRKGDEQRLINRPSLGTYVADGWREFTPAEAVLPGAPPPKVAGQGLIRLVKDGNECLCEGSQVQSWKDNGWSVAGESVPSPASVSVSEVATEQPVIATTEGESDGSEQQPGRKLGEEHGDGDDGKESVDDSGGKQQPSRRRRNRSDRS